MTIYYRLVPASQHGSASGAMTAERPIEIESYARDGVFCDTDDNLFAVSLDGDDQQLLRLSFNLQSVMLDDQHDKDGDE